MSECISWVITLKKSTTPETPIPCCLNAETLRKRKKSWTCIVSFHELRKICRRGGEVCEDDASEAVIRTSVDLLWWIWRPDEKSGRVKNRVRGGKVRLGCDRDPARPTHRGSVECAMCKHRRRHRPSHMTNPRPVCCLSVAPGSALPCGWTRRLTKTMRMSTKKSSRLLGPCIREHLVCLTKSQKTRD